MSQSELLKTVVSVLGDIGIDHMVSGSIPSSLQGEPRAIKNKSVFNLIDTKSGDKIDFWMLTDSVFDKSRFSRKYAEAFAGIHINVSSPEDTILAKLKWAQESGGSEKQFTDAIRVFEVQYDKLDLDYLREWAKKLSVEPLLREIEEKAEGI